MKIMTKTTVMKVMKVTDLATDVTEIHVIYIYRERESAA